MLTSNSSFRVPYLCSHGFLFLTSLIYLYSNTDRKLHVSARSHSLSGWPWGLNLPHLHLHGYIQHPTDPLTEPKCAELVGVKVSNVDQKSTHYPCTQQESIASSHLCNQRHWALCPPILAHTSHLPVAHQQHSVHAHELVSLEALCDRSRNLWRTRAARQSAIIRFLPEKEYPEVWAPSHARMQHESTKPLTNEPTRNEIYASWQASWWQMPAISSNGQQYKRNERWQYHCSINRSAIGVLHKGQRHAVWISGFQISFHRPVRIIAHDMTASI